MPTKKNQYRIRNWPDYNKALVNRGSLFFWLSEEVLTHWMAPQPSGKRGASNKYSDLCILTCLMMRHLYGLKLRGTQGFINSLFVLLGLDLKCPDYTRLSRRSKGLDVPLPRSKEILNVVVDSSGLKVYGEGEWKVRQHGVSKRRTWRKMHLAINPDNQEIVASVLTSNDVSDGQVLDALLDQIPGDLEAVGGDGAYDATSCYEAIYEKGAKPLIPPRRNGVPRVWSKEDALSARDNALKRIENLGGNGAARAQWKREVTYHRRSLAETAMFRFKTIFGQKLSMRTFDNQATELFIKSAILNLMTSLGMPDSFLID